MSEFIRPFPALTPAQRYHFEVYGYVVVPNVLSDDECAALLEALQKLKRELEEAGGGEENPVRGAYYIGRAPHIVHIASIMEADPLITSYATAPRLVGMAEEIIGGEARIVEFNAIINTRDPQQPSQDASNFGFHRGTDAAFGGHVKNGLFHSSFIKTLTNLTELGPDDGGTVVIAGSHKLDVPEADVIACARADSSLIHQVVAPAGSTLLFSESLIHATGPLRSDRERAIIICGYGTRLFPYWDGGQLSAEFAAQIPPHLQTLFHGKANWMPNARYRTLDEPVDARVFTLRDGWNASQGVLASESGENVSKQK